MHLNRVYNERCITNKHGGHMQTKNNTENTHRRARVTTHTDGHEQILSFESNYEQRPVVRRFPPDFAWGLFAASHTEVACCTWCQGFFDHLLSGLSAPRETSYFYTDFQIDAVRLWAVSILIEFFFVEEKWAVSHFSEVTFHWIHLNPSAAFVRVVVGIRMPFKPSECLASLPNALQVRFLFENSSEIISVDQWSRRPRWRAQASVNVTFKAKYFVFGGGKSHDQLTAAREDVLPLNISLESPDDLKVIIAESTEC